MARTFTAYLGNKAHTVPCNDGDIYQDGMCPDCGSGEIVIILAERWALSCAADCGFIVGSDLP